MALNVEELLQDYDALRERIDEFKGRHECVISAERDLLLATDAFMLVTQGLDIERRTASGGSIHLRATDGKRHFSACILPEE